MTITKQRLESKIEKICNEYVEQRFTDSCDDGDRMIARIASKHSANEILAPLLLEMVEAIQRRMKSDEACGHHFDENLGDALNEMEKFLK